MSSDPFDVTVSDLYRTPGRRKNNLTGTTAPTTSDDAADGYEVLSFWVDTVLDELYVCIDPTASAAVWVALAGGGTGGGGGGSLASARATRTSGSVTMNSTTWANVDTGIDLVVPAQDGDILDVQLSALIDAEAVYAFLDGCTLVGGSPVNYISGSAGGASAQGVSGWTGITGVITPTGTGVQYVVTSGDISSGTVTLRLRYRTNTATNKTLLATTNIPLRWSVANLTGTGNGSGTSNPNSPATGDRFFRTDLGLLIYYDGTRWLSVHELNAFGVIRAAAQAYTVTTTLGTTMTLTAGNDLWVTKVRWMFYVATTLNGSNYWTLSGLGSSLVLNTGYSANTFYGVDVTVGSAYTVADFVATKTAGSPGGITVGYAVFCRRIVT